MARELGFFSLSARQGRKIINKCLSNNKGWKKNFFHVSTSRLYETDPGSVVVVPTVWSAKLKGKADLFSFVFPVILLHGC